MSQAELTSLVRQIETCRACPLADSRTNVVPGEGKAPAALMFVGEGPGQTEDELGRPFVGRSGALLDTLVREELGLSRQDFYIANTVKCRPPHNRTPTQAEVEACRPFLTRQLALVDPAVIVALGQTAAAWFLGADVRVTLARGRVHEVDARALLVTYHPSAALRGGAMVVAQLRSDIARAGLVLAERR